MISFKDIIISNDENGKPEIILSQSTLELVQSILQCYSLRFHISLSNSNENAVASVIIEQKKISKG